MYTVLVTGGAGFIGSHLCKTLIKTSRVISLDDYSTGSIKNHCKGVSYINGNAKDIAKLVHEHDFDVCFHLAGLSRIQPSFESPNKTFNANTLTTQRVLDWCKINNTKLVYAGSSSRHHNPYQSPYSLYKYLGEEICKMYKAVYKMDVEIARFYNVYGPGEIIDGDWAAVIGIWRRQIRDGEPITIVGDGEQRRDFTHVDDIVDGLIRISSSDQAHHDAWELGSGKNYSINEIASLFRKRFNCKVEYIDDQNGNYRETLRVQNDAIDLLGWTPMDKLKEYILGL